MDNINNILALLKEIQREKDLLLNKSLKIDNSISITNNPDENDKLNQSLKEIEETAIKVLEILRRCNS